MLGKPTDVAQAPDVFAYLDVCSYLRDVYTHNKARKRGFSYRSFSRRAGLRTPNHLKRIIDGDRTLTPEMAVRYATALGLKGDTASYFCDLAAFGRASSHEERNSVYERLRGYRSYKRAHRLELVHAQYCSTWYIPVIREMVLRRDFRDDPAWVAEQLIPPIRPSEAEEALNILVDLGMLLRTEDGIEQSDRVVTTGPETRGLHIRNYHQQMMVRAVQSMDLVPAAERDISSLTLCVGEGKLAEVKDRIQRFRQELIALVTADDGGGQVLQLNIQLFPMSQPPKDEP